MAALAAALVAAPRNRVDGQLTVRQSEGRVLIAKEEFLTTSRCELWQRGRGVRKTILCDGRYCSRDRHVVAMLLSTEISVVRALCIDPGSYSLLVLPLRAGRGNRVGFSRHRTPSCFFPCPVRPHCFIFS